MQPIDKYTSIVAWARARYTKNGVLVMDHGGIKSAYSRIECAAFEKYMRCTRDEEGCLVFPVDAYRLERFYANGAKIKPLPARTFSLQEVQSITDWFKSIGWSVTSGSGGNGINATNDIGMTIDDLPKPYTAAQRKKDEALLASDERAAAKKKEQEGYLTSTAAGKFVAGMFGDAMNRYNQVALAKVLSGDEKTFAGLFSNSAADVLSEAGISAEGREIKDVIRDIKAMFDAAPTSTAKEPWQMTEAEFGEVERQKALAAGREDLAARARANLREHLAAGHLTDALREDRQAISDALRQITDPDPTSPATHTPSSAPTNAPGYTPPAPDHHQQTAPVPNLADNMPRAVGADLEPEFTRGAPGFAVQSRTTHQAQRLDALGAKTMTNISTATPADLRQTLRNMRAENLDASTQLDLIHSDIIGINPATFEHNGGNTDPNQATTIRAGRLMVRCLAKNAARTAAKLRSASKAPARRAVTIQRSYPKFEAGMSTAAYVNLYAMHNGGTAGAQTLPYNLADYATPCALYENGALDFDAIEETIDAPDATESPEMVAIVSELTGATMASIPREKAEELAAMIGTTVQAARQVSELIANATTAAAIEHASEQPTEAQHQDEADDARELETVTSEPDALATTCDASSAGNAGSAPTHGRASSAAHQAPAAPTFQTITGKSGNWCARFRLLSDGAPVLEFSTRPDDWSIQIFSNGRDRMAALQAMARKADQDAQPDDQDDPQTARQRRINAFDAMTATAADVQAMGAEYVAQLLEDLEDINHHTEYLILQCLAAGREDLAARARANLREHLAAGHLTDALRIDRQAISEALRQSTKQRAYKGLFALVTKRQARELWNIGEPIGLLTYKRNTPFECDTMNAEYKAFNSFDEKVTGAESQLRSGERLYFYAPAEHTGYPQPAPHHHQQTAPVPNLADKVPRAVGADSGPASNPPGATAPSAPAPSAPAPSAPAPAAEASADESEPEFTRTRPQPFDMLAMIAAGLAPADLVGLGIVYSGDRANPSGHGAITDVQPCSWYKYTITVTLEDGRQSRLNPVSFTEHLGNRYKTDFKRHGAPYLAELAAARLAVEAADKAAKQAAADDKARQRRELPQQWPQLKAYDPAGKLNGPTLAAHNIRVLLKERFPKIKFSVKSDRYSGGDAIDIRWTDGPNTKAVEKIADQFEAGSFNGQEDIYEYSSSVFRDLFGDAKYIHCNRDISDALLAQAIEAEYPGTESRPTVEDYRKARGVFSYDHHNGSASRRIRERLETMGAGLPS